MQNALIRALGAQEKVELDATECTLFSKDVVLLCTDALTRMVEDSEIAKVLLESPDAQTSTQRLVVLANEHGGEDNVSVIALHVSEMV